MHCEKHCNVSVVCKFMDANFTVFSHMNVTLLCTQCFTRHYTMNIVIGDNPGYGVRGSVVFCCSTSLTALNPAHTTHTHTLHHMLTHSPTHCTTHLLTHSLHSLTHSFTHTLTITHFLSHSQSLTVAYYCLLQLAANSRANDSRGPQRRSVLPAKWHQTLGYTAVCTFPTH